MSFADELFGFRYIDSNGRQWAGSCPESPFACKTFSGDFVFDTIDNGRECLRELLEAAQLVAKLWGGVGSFFKAQNAGDGIFFFFFFIFYKKLHSLFQIQGSVHIQNVQGNQSSILEYTEQEPANQYTSQSTSSTTSSSGTSYKSDFDVGKTWAPPSYPAFFLPEWERYIIPFFYFSLLTFLFLSIFRNKYNRISGRKEGAFLQNPLMYLPVAAMPVPLQTPTGWYAEHEKSESNPKGVLINRTQEHPEYALESERSYRKLQQELRARPDFLDWTWTCRPYYAWRAEATERKANWRNSNQTSGQEPPKQWMKPQVPNQQMEKK